MTIFISEVASWCYWYQLCHYWHLNFYLKNIDVAWPLFSIFCHVLCSEMILDTRGLGGGSQFLKSSLKYIQYKAENGSSLQNSIMAALISSNNRTNCLEGLRRGTHIAKVISSSFFPWARVQQDLDAAVTRPAVASSWVLHISQLPP